MHRARRGQRLHETSVEIEVPFHDVDALRIVWHGHYYKYLELARTQLLRSREQTFRADLLHAPCLSTSSVAPSRGAGPVGRKSPEREA